MIREQLRRVLLGISKQVAKNHLFEQPNERPLQEPIFALNSEQGHPIDLPQIQLADSHQIEESLLQFSVIHHWATWCSSCVEEMPILLQLQEKIGAQKMLGIVWDLFQGGQPQMACQEVDDMLKAHQLLFAQKVVTDSPERFFAQMDMQEQLVPQTFVFSPFGELLFHQVGTLEQQQIEEIASLIQQ